MRILLVLGSLASFFFGICRGQACQYCNLCGDETLIDFFKEITIDGVTATCQQWFGFGCRFLTEPSTCPPYQSAFEGSGCCGTGAEQCSIEVQIVSCNLVGDGPPTRCNNVVADPEDCIKQVLYTYKIVNTGEIEQQVDLTVTELIRERESQDMGEEEDDLINFVDPTFLGPGSVSNVLEPASINFCLPGTVKTTATVKAISIPGPCEYQAESVLSVPGLPTPPTPALPTPPPPTPGDDFELIESYTNPGACMEATGSSNDNRVILEACDTPNESQQFSYDPVSKLIRLKTGTNKCLQVGKKDHKFDGLEAGMWVRVGDCDSSLPRQKFDWDTSNSKFLTLTEFEWACVVFQGTTANLGSDNIVIVRCDVAGSDRPKWVPFQ